MESPPRSPLRDAEDQMPAPSRKPSVSAAAGGRVGGTTDSRFRSPLGNASDLMPVPAQKANPLVSPAVGGAKTDSSVRSPVRNTADLMPVPAQNGNPLVFPAVGGREGATTGSRVRSPLRDAEDLMPVPAQNANLLASPAAVGRERATTDSPVQSPLRDAENPISPPQRNINPHVAPTGFLREVAATGSPIRSLARRAESPIPVPLQKGNTFSSSPTARGGGESILPPFRSAIDAENPIAGQREGAMTVGSVLRSHLWDSENSIVPQRKSTQEKQASLEVANSVIPDLRMSTKVGGGGGRGIWEGGDEGQDRERGLRVKSGIRRRAPLSRAAVGLRVSALVLSLVSFSVMASDKTSGWAGDSFDRYKEYRYCLAVNVVAFVYSAFQLYSQVHRRIKMQLIISRPNSYFLDFSMDQVLAYLLMSASSSAASRNDDWITSFGSDEFTKRINGSVAMSFLAFLALAASSVISAYKLFSWNP